MAGPALNSASWKLGKSSNIRKNVRNTHFLRTKHIYVTCQTHHYKNTKYSVHSEPLRGVPQCSAWSLSCSRRPATAPVCHTLYFVLICPCGLELSLSLDHMMSPDLALTLTLAPSATPQCGLRTPLGTGCLRGCRQCRAVCLAAPGPSLNSQTTRMEEEVIMLHLKAKMEVDTQSRENASHF